MTQQFTQDEKDFLERKKEQLKQEYGNETFFLVPEVNMRDLEAKVEKLNKKALKLGCQPISLETVQQFLVPQKINGRTCNTTFYEIRVHGGQPKYAGWTFAATLEPTEAGHIIKAVPGIEVPTEFREADLTCHHCNTDRYRKETFLVQHEDGTFRKVGRNCLKDFLGHQNPTALARLAQLIVEFMGMAEEEFCGGYFQPPEPSYSLEQILSLANVFIDRFGFVTRKAAQFDESATPTASEVEYCLAPPYVKGVPSHEANRILREWNNHVEKHKPTEADQEKAKKALAWISSFEGQEVSDYFHNLLIISKLEGVTSKQLGLAASAMWAYRKEVEKDEHQKVEKLNEHVGQVKKREVFELKRKRTITIESGDRDCAGYYLHLLEDPDGREFVWFTSKDGPGNMTEFTRMKATVKAHREYKGKKQTVINRVTEL